MKKSLSFNSPPALEKEKLNDYLKNEIHEKKIEDVNQKNIYDLTWDSNLENLFSSLKKSGRSLFLKEKNNGKWTGIPIMNIIQSLFKEEKKKKERSHLLEKYANSECLTAEEYKFIADTSNLLNRCIDKKFMQKAVNIVEPTILHYVWENLFLTNKLIFFEF